MRNNEGCMIWGFTFIIASLVEMIVSTIIMITTENLISSILWGIMPFVVIMIMMPIIYYTVANAKEKRLQEAMLATNFSQIDVLTPFEFEEWVARLMRLKGYKAYATKASGDYGVDVIAETYGNRIGIQVKKYHKAVGIKAIQEVVCGLSYYGCNEGWVVTTAPYFTTAAKETAKLHGIRLIAHDDLVLLFNDAQKSNKK